MSLLSMSVVYFCLIFSSILAIMVHGENVTTSGVLLSKSSENDLMVTANDLVVSGACSSNDTSAISLCDTKDKAGLALEQLQALQTTLNNMQALSTVHISPPLQTQRQLTNTLTYIDPLKIEMAVTNAAHGIEFTFSCGAQGESDNGYVLATIFVDETTNIGWYEGTQGGSALAGLFRQYSSVSVVDSASFTYVHMPGDTAVHDYRIYASKIDESTFGQLNTYKQNCILYGKEVIPVQH